jgi:peptidoglycan/xylan/chitin deacetylase (PgdA/CDA1 family)
MELSNSGPQARPSRRSARSVRSLTQLVLMLCLSQSCASLLHAQSVAITMDDLDVNADDTPLLSLEQRNAAILAALDRVQLKAIIFVCGTRVDSEIGRRHLDTWARAGHLIGNHSWTHPNFSAGGAEMFGDEVLRTEALLEELHGFTRMFRFPMLKEGRTAEQRDGMRDFLSSHGYRNGYVTIDTSDWAIDARLRRRLHADPTANLEPYRRFYLEHMWQRAQYYDGLAKKVLGRSPSHTLLVHHNLVSALFLPDLLHMFSSRGWTLIDAATAYKDPIFAAQPNILPAGESIVWALAKESQRFDKELRFPAEDGEYEDPRMDAVGL